MAGLAEGMEAAGALIESLKQEVESLRSDLKQASAALKRPRRGSLPGPMSGGEGAGPRRGGAGGRGPEGGDLLAQTAALGRAAPPEQRAHQRAREVRRKPEEQRLADVDAASSDSRVDTIKEEFRREREALEARQEGDRSPQERLRALGRAAVHELPGAGGAARGRDRVGPQ